MTDYRSQLWHLFERADHFDDHGRYIGEHGQYGTAIGERYRRNNVACHVHVALNEPVVELGSREFCAEFYRAELESEASIRGALAESLYGDASNAGLGEGGLHGGRGD